MTTKPSLILFVLSLTPSVFAVPPGTQYVMCSPPAGTALVSTPTRPDLVGTYIPPLISNGPGTISCWASCSSLPAFNYQAPSTDSSRSESDMYTCTNPTVGPCNPARATGYSGGQVLAGTIPCVVGNGTCPSVASQRCNIELANRNPALVAPAARCAQATYGRTYSSLAPYTCDNSIPTPIPTPLTTVAPSTCLTRSCPNDDGQSHSWNQSCYNNGLGALPNVFVGTCAEACASAAMQCINSPLPFPTCQER